MTVGVLLVMQLHALVCAAIDGHARSGPVGIYSSVGLGSSMAARAVFIPGTQHQADMSLHDTAHTLCVQLTHGRGKPALC